MPKLVFPDPTPSPGGPLGLCASEQPWAQTVAPHRGPIPWNQTVDTNRGEDPKYVGAHFGARVGVPICRSTF